MIERKGVYQYSINMKYKQGARTENVCVCVCVYVRFGFAFPFGHQGDRTTAPAPLPPDEASIAEEING